MTSSDFPSLGNPVNNYEIIKVDIKILNVNYCGWNVAGRENMLTMGEQWGKKEIEGHKDKAIVMKHCVLTTCAEGKTVLDRVDLD